MTSLEPLFVEERKQLPEHTTCPRPTNAQIQDWLWKTQGQLSPEVIRYGQEHGKQGILSACLARTAVVYNGSLTIAQQWWIFCELNRDDKVIE